MNYLVTGSEMHEIDAYTINVLGVPSVELMENAANAVVREIRGLLSGKPSIVVLCGSGNNGGDGIAIARIMAGEGYDICAAIIGDPAHGTDEWQYQFSKALEAGVHFIGGLDEISEKIASCAVIVDAMLGTGLSRNVSGRYSEVIDLVNESSACTVAVDIPSGISSDTGAVLGTAVKADMTVTFQYKKIGQIMYPGREYCGKLCVHDIGISAEGADKILPKAWIFSDEDKLPARPQYSNKGTFGRVLIVAGAVNMCGASYLSALAAYRTGAGLVEILAPEENRVILQTLIPEAVLSTYTGTIGREQLAVCAKRADCAVIGPGMGINDNTHTALEYFITESGLPVVIDADGLNVLSRDPELMSCLSERMILTPHLKEFSRLTGLSVAEIKENIAGTGRLFAEKYHVNLALKDACTLVFDPEGRMYVNPYGNSGMATGGSGDVLSGVIGGLLASDGLDPYDAGCYGVMMHACAGDRAAEKYGERAVMARDIADNIR